MFGDEYGVPEDPATGSANGCHAVYLVQYKYFGEPEIDIRVEQGNEIQRPSLLRLRASTVLGTAFILRQEIARTDAKTIRLNLAVGQIPVTFEHDVLWMTQIAPTFGPTLDVENIAPVLNLDPLDIDMRFPIQQVSTALPVILVPLKNLDAVRRAHVNLSALKKLIASREAKMIFIFSPETYHAENQINARMFGDEYGVSEDPATGSANGCLAGYLAYYQYWGKREIDIRVEQGYEIQRPSLL